MVQPEAAIALPLLFIVNVPVNGVDEAVIDMIKEGVMIGPASQQTAEIGRKYTNRQMPW